MLAGLSISERWFHRLVLGAIALGFFVLVSVGAMAASAILQNQAQIGWINHGYHVERAIARYRVLVERLEAARRGMLLRDDPAVVGTFASTAAAIGPALADLQRLTADNPRQQANMAFAAKLSRAHLTTLRRSVALVGLGRRDAAVAAFNSDQSLPLIRMIRSLCDRMTAEEDRLLARRDAEQAQSLTRFYIAFGVAAVLLAIVGIGSIWIIARYTRDLSASRDELRLLNAGLEGAVAERTIDLQRANDEIQRFAYIVSHDLRAPLVNIMGFTTELESAAAQLARMMDRVEAHMPELVDQAARIAARDDLPEAIGFIRTSSDKMDRLIKAILRLSREGRRPLTPEPLDMTVLAQDVADTLRHRLDEIGAEMRVQPDLPRIVSDRLAVEQIVSNLAENAVKYLNPDHAGRIEIRGRTEGARAMFEVADNGRGIDPRDHERIFDLFRRSGVQDQPGEGIGLAHTRALAYRLGGAVTVESELGSGAVFRLTLPVTFAGEQGPKA